MAIQEKNEIIHRRRSTADDGSPNFPGRDFPGGRRMPRDWRWIWDENFDRSTYFTHGAPPPSFFVRPACSPLLSLVLSMEGTSCAARLMPAGHDCAAITRSSGMTKMSKRKIMVRKWSGGWGWNEYRRNWWAPVKNPWEVDDESQLRSRKRNRRWGCLGCVVSWLMLFFKEDLN